MTGRKSSARRTKPSWLSVALIAGACAGVASQQLPLRAESLKLKETSDAYLLPPPDQLVVASLGYRAALADLLWAQVIVEQGLRAEQQRGYETVGNYLWAIIELDPKFREPYLHSDTLLTFQAVEVPLENVYEARKILERAVKERPNDAMLWLQLGQFVAYIAAPSYLKNQPEEQKRWREEGARILARAAELGVTDSNIQWQALGGASILNRAGERDASVRFLQRILATTEDEELRTKVEQQLFALLGEAAREAYFARRAAFLSLARQAYPGQPAEFIFAAGVPTHPQCVGGSRAKGADSPECAATWAEWAERASPPTMP